MTSQLINDRISFILNKGYTWTMDGNSLEKKRDDINKGWRRRIDASKCDELITIDQYGRERSNMIIIW